MAAKPHESGAIRGSSRQDLAILAVLLAFRAVNALTVRTFFQPDEYFQSLEPAWQAAFGSGNGAWITWEWREGLRSSLHPLLFAGVYRAAAQLGNILGLSASARAEVLIASPKLMQAIFAAAMDFLTYNLANRTYGHNSNAAYATLFLTVASPWQAFCSVRTLSNSIETTLTILALYLWPWDWFGGIPTAKQHAIRRQDTGTTISASPASPANLCTSLAAAALACILRPTNIIIWAAVSLTILLRFGNLSKLLKLAQAALLSGGAVLAVSVSADRAFYNNWVLPPLRFLQFNLIQSLAVFYGKNRPDYYLTEGLPLLLLTALPFAAVGLWQGLRAVLYPPGNGDMKEQAVRFTLATAVLITVLVLSLVSHKEMRFVYPLLPMLHILAAKPFTSFFAPSSLPRKNYRQALLLLIVGVNVLIGWYTLFVHQRGVIDVVHFLRTQHEASVATSPLDGTSNGDAGDTTVGFLMPCHSTPWRSHLVYPGIHAWALSCEPPLNLTMAARKTYLDEADVFYDDPVAWLANNIGDNEPHARPWPQYLIFFEQLEGTLSSLRRDSSFPQYEESWRGFNTHWHDDSRRKGDVIVWRQT